MSRIDLIACAASLTSRDANLTDLSRSRSLTRADCDPHSDPRHRADRPRRQDRTIHAWVYVILFLPGIGAAAYIVAELAAGMARLATRDRSRARRWRARSIPARRYRELTDDLALVDTIANRAALAEECLTLGKFDEALLHYSAISSHPLAEEPQFFLGKARAQFGLRQSRAAIATLDELVRRWPDFHSADGHLLYAIALEESGRNDEALAQYANVGQYYPGVEPRVRQAQLLQKLGRGTEAKTIAEDVVRGLNRAPAHVRRNQREWLASAQRLARG